VPTRIGTACGVLGSSVTKLIFVRHGETTHNVHAVISSAAPGPGINANGRGQARGLAGKLSASPIDRVYTSPLRRARQTAEILVRQRRIIPILSPALRECGVGALEGRSDTAAFSRYHDVWDRWLGGQALDFPLGPGGETGHAVLARMHAMINGACAADPDGTVLLVSHAGILHFTLSLLLTNLASVRDQLLPIPNAGVVMAVHDTDGLRCEDWCGTPVLGEA
jgi:broad specificity phosphatase PhoE